MLIASTAAFAQFWEAAGGPERNEFYGMHVTANGDVFVVSTAIHRSQDRGEHWTMVHKPDKTDFTSYLQIASSRSGMLYLLSETALLRSSDHGDTWTQLRSVNGSSMTVSQSGMVVMTTNDSLLVSVDQGDTWTGTRIPHNASGVCVDMDDIIYISDSHYLYRSKDRGRTCISVLDGLTYDYVPRHIVAVKSGTAIGAIDNYIYSSSDSGRVWSKGHQASSQIQTIAVVGRDSLYMLKRDYTVELSTDGGNTWKGFGRTFPDSSSPYTMEILAQDGYLYGLFEKEVYRTLLDTISPWTRLSVPNASIFNVVPTSDGVIHALSKRHVNSPQELSKFWMYREQWQPEFSGEFTKVSAFSADSSRRLYAMMTRTFMRSDDGKSWSEGVSLSNSNAFQFAHTKDHDYLVSDQAGIFRTDDAGVNWEDVNTGIKDLRLFSVAATEDMIYTGGVAKFYRSSNKGATWQEPVFPFIIGSGNVRSISALDSEIVVAVDLTGVYFSSDRGTIWRNRSQGLPPLDTITSVLLTPNRTVLATTRTSIFQFSRVSETWTDVTREIKANILSMALGFDGKIYVGTDGDGVYRSTKTYGIGGTGSVQGYTDQLDDVMLYPTPASGYVNIVFTNARPSLLEVVVVNLLGEELLASTGTDVIDVSALKAGQYFLRINADGALRIIPLTIVK